MSISRKNMILALAHADTLTGRRRNIIITSSFSLYASKSSSSHGGFYNNNFIMMMMCMQIIASAHYMISDPFSLWIIMERRPPPSLTKYCCLFFLRNIFFLHSYCPSRWTLWYLILLRKKYSFFFSWRNKVIMWACLFYYATRCMQMVFKMFWIFCSVASPSFFSSSIFVSRSYSSESASWFMSTLVEAREKQFNCLFHLSIWLN